MNETSSIRPSFLIVSLLSLIWLGLAGWSLASEGLRPASAFAAIQAFALILTPVAALFALAAAVGNKETLPTLRASDSLEDAEARLTGIASRIDALRTGLGGELEGLLSASAALEARSNAAQSLVAGLTAASASALEAGNALETAIPNAVRNAEALRLALIETGAEARSEADRAEAATHALAAALEAARTEGGSAAATLAESLALLEARATAGRTQSEAGMRAIRGEAETLFEFLENTLIAKRDALGRQGESMGAQLADGYARLDALATAASDQLAQRLDALSQAAAGIEERLKAQAHATDSLASSGERAFQLLDARLQHSSETSRTALDKLAARIQQVGSDLAGLTLPLKDTQSAAHDLDSAVKGLRESALQTVDVLGETLPARTVEASRAAETLAAELRALVSAIDDAHVKAAALADPIAESRAAIDTASAAFAAQRTAIEAAGQALVVELTQARSLIGDVEEQTRDTSLSAATRLVEAMARVREVATQATGTMREMLDGVLAEARDSLSATADQAMKRSFVEPIAEQARAAETAAAAAAERTAASMAALAGTLKLLEERGADRMGAFEAALQQDLLAASALLTERLSLASVSIGSALGKPMEDADWAAWRKGERGFFNRRTLGLLEKREARELKALLASDPVLAQSARDYTSAFDALVTRFEGPAPALAAALQASDQGRLAAALSEVLSG
jgi:predicted  nucleic acid-binding Zn-ribbon protein